MSKFTIAVRKQGNWLINAKKILTDSELICVLCVVWMAGVWTRS